jgi:hypothetical protein
VSLVFLEPFQELVENPVDTKGGELFELNSHLVTIALEMMVEDAGDLKNMSAAARNSENGGRKEEAAAMATRRYQPADTLALDGSFLFSLEFAFLNRSFNQTERRIACGEVTTPLAFSSPLSATPGGGETHDTAATVLRPSPHCRLVFVNVTAGPPRCICNRSGTYGLIIPVLQRREAGLPVFGVAKVSHDIALPSPLYVQLSGSFYWLYAEKARQHVVFIASRHDLPGMITTARRQGSPASSLASGESPPPGVSTIKRTCCLHCSDFILFIE